MAKQSKPQMPNLDNATPEFLVDELGKVRETLKVANQMEGFYKQALQGRRVNGQNAISGTQYDALISDESQVRIDADKVREYFKDNPAGLLAVSKKIEFQVIRTTKKTEAGAT